MPVENLWVNHTSGASTFYTCDMSDEVVLGSTMSLSTPLNTETQGDDGGQTYDKTRSITSQQPVFTLSTKAISKALETITPDGICICSDGAAKYGMSVYGQARETCGEKGAKPADNAHLQYLVNWGLATPLSLAGSRGGDMVLSMQVDCLTDDASTNAPFAIREDATLPAGADASQFTLGSMIIGDIIMDDIVDFTLDFGVNIAEKIPALGQVWPKLLATSKNLPVLTLTGRNPRILEDFNASPSVRRIPFFGREAAKADTIVRFRKRKNRGTFEDDAATVHMEMAMYGLLLVDNPFDASGAARANTTMRVIGIEDPTVGQTINPVVFRHGVTYSDFQPT